MANGRYFKNLKIAIFLQWFKESQRNLTGWRWGRLNTIASSKFKNP